MNHQCLLLSSILHNNPRVTLAYVDNDSPTPTLHIHSSQRESIAALTIPTEFNALQLARHYGPEFKDLLAVDHRAAPRNENQQCQNEPVRLGTQVQPAGAPWLGTAGSPISWRHPDGTRHWGLLSNYHVLCTAKPAPNHPINQPDDARSPIAHLSQYSQPSPTEDNRIDAAIADSLIDGRHCTGWTIIDLPAIDQTPRPAVPNASVTKVGRTTGRTTARCRAIGAAVRVQYGYYSALFIDQDLYEDTVEPFSEPGDSGSLILTTPCNCPTSLLFAGGGKLAVGNPIQAVLDHFNASFHPS